jgi:hypothetical protein
VKKLKSLYKTVKRTISKPFVFLKNVWYLRKEIWHFRGWDYQNNLELFLKSLELTAEFYEKGEMVASPKEHADNTAKEIREFVHLMRCSQDPYEEAEKLSGVTFERTYRRLDHLFSMMKDDEKKQEHELRQKYNKTCRSIEVEYWDKGMDLLKSRMRFWWD